MKPFLACFVALVLVLAAMPGLAAAADEEITVSGGGWGHGIGMSQYGAQALAEQGKTASQITAHFYQGSGIGMTGQGAVVGHPDPVRIGLAQKWGQQLPISVIGGQAQLCLGAEDCLTAVAGEAWSFRILGPGACQFYKASVAQGLPGTCNAQITWGNQPSTRIYLPSLPPNKKDYARGKIVLVQVPNNPSQFHVVLEIGIEPYLYGLGEMPSSWHLEALKAQAIAGRTYAVQTARSRNPISADRMIQCGCHLYASTQDQSYIGWVKEGQGSGWGARWKSAVDATAGQVVTHPSVGNRAIEAYYFSTTGGRTENNEDLWGGTARPYLRSVSDPGAKSWTGPPFNDPPKTFTYEDFAQRLGFSRVWSAKFGPLLDSGRPSSITVTGFKAGAITSQSFTTPQLKTALGLRSAYITKISGLVPEEMKDSVVGDFDGDPATEVAAISNSGEWWVFDLVGGQVVGRPWKKLDPGSTHHLAGDFNEDGRTDIANYYPANGSWWVTISTGSGFTVTKWATLSPHGGWEFFPGDFDEDGRMDIAGYYSGNGTWWVSRSTGSGFVTTQWTSGFSPRTGWEFFPGDYDGDGDTDIAAYYRANGTWWVSRSTGNGFVTTKWTSSFSPNTGWEFFPGDYNGDGHTDIASYYSGNGTWWVSRSTGSGFLTTKWTSSFAPKTGWAFVPGDYNGDGRTDIAGLYSGNRSLWVSTSSGSGFSTKAAGSYPSGMALEHALTPDIDYDQESDLVIFGPGYWFLSFP